MDKDNKKTKLSEALRQNLLRRKRSVSEKEPLSNYGKISNSDKIKKDI